MTSCFVKESDESQRHYVEALNHLGPGALQGTVSTLATRPPLARIAGCHLTSETVFLNGLPAFLCLFSLPQRDVERLIPCEAFCLLWVYKSVFPQISLLFKLLSSHSIRRFVFRAVII